MSTSYQRAIAYFSRRDRVKIEKNLRNWAATSIGATVASNLRDREHFLPRRFMIQLLKVVKDSPPDSAKGLESAYQGKCYRLQCKGGIARIKSSSAIVLGCAIDRDLFADYLVDNSGGFIPTRALALDLIRRLKVDPVTLRPREHSLLLKAYTTWVTWDASDASKDPFGFIIHGLADEVRASLGLDERLRGPLLLFRYEKNTELLLHRPTIADAGLYKYFTPPITSQRHYGLTRPWEVLLVYVGGVPQEIEVHPKPEGVHRHMRLGVLELPVNELP